MENVEKLDGFSMNVHEAHVDALRAVCPGVFTEGRVDWDKLATVLAGHVADEKEERYGLNWAGKSKCFAEVAQPTTKTLVPVRDESINFDTTENLFIEGENLEVLKMLQRSYYGKVKMIYIDPPYNTGKDFVYHDSFQRGDKEEREEGNQTDAEGYVKSAYKQNSKDSGRYHSNWLNMMYPRLYLARNLLRDDGVIFVSIDDNEVHNLRMLMNEIFGEENFVGILTWAKKRKGSFLSDEMISLTEYCVIYAKNRPTRLFGGRPDSSESQPILKRTNARKTLLFKGGVVTTKLKDGEYKEGQYGEGSNMVTLLDSVTVQNGVIATDFKLEGPFTWSQETLETELGKEGARIVINTSNFQPRVYRVYDDGASKGLPSLLIGTELSATNEDGYEEVLELFGAEKVFDYPKPVNYLKHLISAATYWNKDAVILDFFSGSGTTAQAVLDLNKEDNGTRKFICVQIPEETPEDSEARKAGHTTIADITKARIKKVIEKSGNTALGFKVFKTASSNFAIWRTREFASAEELSGALEAYIREEKKATTENRLFEVLLKGGLGLTPKIEEKQGYYRVNDGTLAVTFAERMTSELFAAMLAEKPRELVCVDASFAGNDELKANIALRLKEAGVEFRVI